jgi:integrase
MAGIEVRHRRACTTRTTGDWSCVCRPTFCASVTDERTQKLIRSRTSKEIDAAVAWRRDKLSALRRGERHREDRTTIKRAGEQLITGMQDGTVRTRSGKPYKPSTWRGCEQALRDYVVPMIGSERVSELERGDVQAIVDELVEDGMSASTARNAILPLRLICRRAFNRQILAANPTLGLELPAVDGRRDRVATKAEARALIAGAESEAEQDVWATAIYAGVRRGELRALLADEVDLDAGFICVRSSWDPVVGRVDPKSRAGVRDIPIVSQLRAAQRLPVRLVRVRAVPAEDPPEPRGPCVEKARARQDHSPRVPPHARVADDRGRREREVASDLHGPRINCNHDGSVRPSASWAPSTPASSAWTSGNTACATIRPPGADSPRTNAGARSRFAWSSSRARRAGPRGSSGTLES